MSMTENSRPTYTRSPNWNVVYEGSILVLNAGADKIFAIEDVSEDVATEIMNLLQEKVISPIALSTEGKEIFEQLKTAQIVFIDLEPKVKYKISIRYNGDKNKELDAQIKAQLTRDFEVTDKLNYDFQLIIRTNGRLRDAVSSGYNSLTKPHLFLDIAYEHSISLGPLVFPGETACISCLVGRITTYWGDAEPPITPSIQINLEFIAGLVAMEVRKILNEYNRELVNNTIAYDFENHKVKKSSVYKLPMCPVCSISTMDNPGSIKLPWAQTK
ncbi:MAG: hypothetical protein NVS1B7_6390 [Candidatus Saccharimonadales bacterium]